MQMKSKILALTLGAVLSLGFSTAEVKAAENVDTISAAAAVDDAKAAAIELPYTYTSKEYGYTIKTPKKPNVIAANLLYEGKTGEILIFDNEEYNIKKAWVVIKDAFDGSKVPDYNTMSADESKKYLKDLVASNGYEGAMLVPLANNNKAVYAITAKVLDVDTDGDGKPDATVTASSQNAVVFFRTPDKKCYSMLLIDNPELTDSAIEEFQQGLLTFAD